MGLLKFIKGIFAKADVVETVVDSVTVEVAKAKKVKADAKEVVAKVEAKVSKPKAKKATK